MSRPPINPDKSVAGIALDPQTLERVIPESRRPDGSVRKQIKIRPGFTPQEDVKRFRGTRQAQMDATALPKGHIIGWAPPSSTSVPTKPLSKSAKKNAKRKEKRAETQKTADPVPDDWEDDDEPAGKGQPPATVTSTDDISASTRNSVGDKATDKSTELGKNGKDTTADNITDKLAKLDVK